MALKALWEVDHLFGSYNVDTLGLVDLQSTLLGFTVHAMNGVVFFTLFVGNFLLENFCW